MKNIHQDKRPGTKTLLILLRLLAAPKRYTKRELAEFIGLKFNDPSAVSKHLENIQAAGIQLNFDKHYRYYIVPQRGFKELDYLSPFSDTDKHYIKKALQGSTAASSAKVEALLNKLESLYDWQSLGLDALRAPEIEKINDLEAAARKKRRVVLVGYRSRNSGVISDRIVEPFAIEPDIGMVRAYDTQKYRTSHFILSRMDRVRLLDEDWAYEQEHYRRESDPFNIVMDQRDMIHLRLGVSAYNDLIEHNPRARNFARPGRAPNTFDWQARVNAKYIGLLPFVLANWEDVEVLGSTNFKEILADEVKDMLKKYIPIKGSDSVG